MLASLFIMLREGFEAALIVAIIYAYIRKIDRRDLLGPMWSGVAVAVGISVATGVVVHTTVAELEGTAEMRAFAVIALSAVVVLTWMVFWMRTHARVIKGELQHSIDAAVSRGRGIWWAVILASFFAVLREGIEAALFLMAAATADTGTAVLIGGMIGLAIAIVAGYLVVLGGKRLPMSKFFQVTGVMLIVFAAGLLSRSVLFLQTAGDLGSLWDSVYDLNAHTWLTIESEFGLFLTAMVGWDTRPSIEQVVVHLGYLLTVGYLFLRRPKATGSAPQAAAETSAGRG